MYRTKRKFFRLLLILVFLGTFLISGCTPSEGAISSEGSQEGLAYEEEKSQDQIKVQEEVEVIDTGKESLMKNNNEEPLQLSKRAIPILYYHSIAYEEGNVLRIPAEEFESHMQLLRENNYESITLDELYEYFYGARVLPEKPIVITFDDGYEDNYINAFPIAEKYGYRGTIFMVTDWIDGKGYLKREQILEMSQAGWRIESHTRTHPYLNDISLEQVREELLSSKQVLEGLHQEPVTAFAYPYGVYNSAIMELCKEMGYKMGLTTDRGWAGAEDPFRIKRIYCYAQMGQGELIRRIEDQNY